MGTGASANSTGFSKEERVPPAEYAELTIEPFSKDERRIHLVKLARHKGYLLARQSASSSQQGT